MKTIILIKILIISFALTSYSQIQVNAYAKINNITNLTLECSDLDETYDSFDTGDVVMIYQVQDNVIGGNNRNNNNFGEIDKIETSGVFEFAEIVSVTKTGTDMLVQITTFLNEDFNFGKNSSVQLVSFPTFTNHTTADEIVAKPWDGKTGGIVAFDVTGTLTLNHSISADGAGFRGGQVSKNNGNSCSDGTYSTDDSDFGGKGESIFRKNSNNQRHGKGKIANGGGGGNIHNGGGAGGSNFTAGGNGGEGFLCPSGTGGIAGSNLSAYISSKENRLFFGGGGGGGQQNNSVGTNGGNGGGFIFIKANQITVNTNQSISANGTSGPSTFSNGNDGAGGGGAGGSIALVVDDFLISPFAQLSIETNGGNGGNVNHIDEHGSGGAGSGGANKFFRADPSSYPNLVSSTEPGIAGRRSLNAQPNPASEAETGNGTLHYDKFNGGSLGSLLPVKMLSIGINCLDYGVEIVWTTATETNNEYFMIEGSNDAQNWNEISRISGAGNTIIQQDYEYIIFDQNYEYYRLSQTDFDGTREYFDILTATCESDENTFEITSLHHDGSSLQIGIKGIIPGKLDIQVVNSLARPVTYQSISVSGSEQFIGLPLDLETGIYVVSLIQNGEGISKKVMIQ
jgi:hypothetical protein